VSLRAWRLAVGSGLLPSIPVFRSVRDYSQHAQCSTVDHQFELDRSHGRVNGLFALENAAGVDAGETGWCCFRRALFDLATLGIDNKLGRCAVIHNRDFVNDPAVCLFKAGADGFSLVSR
jgi:hypothetical protein